MLSVHNGVIIKQGTSSNKGKKKRLSNSSNTYLTSSVSFGLLLMLCCLILSAVIGSIENSIINNIALLMMLFSTGRPRFPSASSSLSRFSNCSFGNELFQSKIRHKIQPFFAHIKSANAKQGVTTPALSPQDRYRWQVLSSVHMLINVKVEIQNQE